MGTVIYFVHMKHVLVPLLIVQLMVIVGFHVMVAIHVGVQYSMDQQIMRLLHTVLDCSRVTEYHFMLNIQIILILACHQHQWIFTQQERFPFGFHQEMEL